MKTDKTHQEVLQKLNDIFANEISPQDLAQYIRIFLHESMLMYMKTKEDERPDIYNQFYYLTLLSEKLDPVLGSLFDY